MDVHELDRAFETANAGKCFSHAFGNAPPPSAVSSGMIHGTVLGCPICLANLEEVVSKRSARSGS